MKKVSSKRKIKLNPQPRVSKNHQKPPLFGKITNNDTFPSNNLPIPKKPQKQSFSRKVEKWRVYVPHVGFRYYTPDGVPTTHREVRIAIKEAN